jgi:amino acid adenylation domain-containing protein
MDAVAIVGMAGRFPGASSVDEFWRNLVAGKESITRFGPEELSPQDARDERSHPRYVPVRGVIADADRFDAAFFGVAPGEALLMDPQQRVFLELCWNALEHAGIDTCRYTGNIGVYAGVSNNGYRKLVEAREDLLRVHGEFAAMLANEKDYVATRVAHRIGLQGPAISIHTACSTSLVAIAQAWYALMSWQCDAALAGGINIVVPQESGYVPVEGGMESLDGHCRPFDADASGTVFSSGGGAVVLKRLADAIADRDTIWAVIRGVGVNNDGADKASFSAPSARGQAAAVRIALASADVGADTIGYVEAHGTGTALGDPIEIEGLTRAFRADTQAREFCWLGSVKGNFGHLVAGAGVTGLIKAALALHHEQIPPTLHYESPNPEIDFGASPFKLADRLVSWPRSKSPRRAGVSSFGVGGTNAHLILEEAPPRESAEESRLPVLLTLSARDETVLRVCAENLLAALSGFTDADLPDIAFTLATGRRAMAVRGAVIASTLDEARQGLRDMRAYATSGTIAPCAYDADAGILAEAFCRGDEIDWTRHFAGQRRRHVPLPGYPFRGERYWIDAPAFAEKPSDMPTPMHDRRVELLRLVAAACGESISAEQGAVRFLDLGLDSLAMTQLALELERRYGVQLKFRRLMEDVDSIDKLVQWIAQNAPKVSVRAPLSGAASMLSALPANAAESTTDAMAFGAAARITKYAKAEFTAKQRQWLIDFTARYTARTAKSKAFSQRHRAGMADPRVVTGFNPLWKEIVYPLVVERSDGAHLWDIDGNRYIDLLNAFGANFFGYQPEFLRRALNAQIACGFEIGPQHPLTAQVTDLIRELTGVERVAFCNTGSEAVMGAMRLARTVTGRKTIVMFKDSYHGIFDEVIVRGTRELRSIAAAPGILANAVENVLVLDYGSPAALEAIRARAGELAAVLVEPVQSRHPDLQPREFVQALRQLCDANGCALIFDEVITGFRVSPGGAQELFGVRADIVTYGKIIGGGLPLAAIGGSAKWMDALDGGDWRFGDDSRPEAGVTYFAGTFVRHPLALAAAKAALSQLKQGGPVLQRDLNVRTTEMAVRLNAFFAAHCAPLHIVSFSSLWRIRVDADQAFADLFFYALRERGVHVYPQFNCFLTLAHVKVDVDAIVVAIESVVLELLDADILRRKTNAVGYEPQRGLPAEMPMTAAQTEKWLACQFGNGATIAFNESQLLHLRGVLDRSALTQAIARVCARHEAFAMAFKANGSAVCFSAPERFAPTFIDLELTRHTLDAHCAKRLREPFDLTRAPLARIELLRVGVDAHALLIVAHHLIFDGWSARVFIDEVELGYNALRSGLEPAWPVAESFAAFAQAEHVRRAATSASIPYWRQIYARMPDALELPLDRPRRSASDFVANTLFRDVSPSLTAAVREFAKREGVTLYAVLLAVFGVLIARLSGQLDFAVGVPFAAQAAAGRNALIGDGTNTLPLRVSIEREEPFAALARRCHGILLDAAEHQDTTLYTLAKALGLGRGERGVFSDLIFNLNPRAAPLAFDGLACTLRDCVKPALMQDLFFNLNDRGDRLTLDLHYRTALFDAPTIERWIDLYAMLLITAVEPAQAMATLLRRDQGPFRAKLPKDPGFVRKSEADASIVSLIRAQAQRSPKRIAVECRGDVLTYEQVSTRASALARGLLARGIERGEIVGICMPRGAEMLIALLGILASGAAYLPLDPDYPERRLRGMLDAVEVQHILVLGSDPLPQALRERTVLRYTELLAERVEAIVLPEESGDALAYVLYTSGSSGAPKGVCVTQRSVSNCLTSLNAQLGLHQDDVLCAVSPLTFDIAALELYLPLLTGARVLIATERERRDPDALIGLLHSGHASVRQTTPSWLRVLVGESRVRRLPRMRLLVGGEVLPRDLAETLLAQSTEVWNLYGPTEATIWSTCSRVHSGAGPVPIGRPIANTRIHLLDKHGQRVLPGSRGEIWISGAGVAVGYLRQPELTAERFQPDPFVEGERMYRSGDIGSWQAGELWFHGRHDDQFKFHGFRIEPAEIEAAALAEPGVEDAVATLAAARSGEPRLVLYVATSASGPAFANQLRERLRDCLPAAFVPRHIELLPALPRTAHGKIDRDALPEPKTAPRAVPSPAPDTLAHALLVIWRELLGVDAVTLDSNFFDLGGDSFLGVELFQRAQMLTGVNLPLSTLLTAQTVREQSRVFGAAGARDPVRRATAALTAIAQSWSPLVPIQTSGSRPPLFCVHAIGGNVLNFVPLARALGEERPVFGLQAVGLDGVSRPLASIQEMAARY